MRKLVEREGLADHITIDSAGTAAYHIGKQPDHRTQLAARERGIDMSTLRARQAMAQDFRDFDLVLAMDKENFRHLDAIRPSDAGAKLQLFLKDYGTMGYQEVPDPYYGGAEGFELVLDLLEDACTALLQTLKAGK